MIGSIFETREVFIRKDNFRKIIKDERKLNGKIGSPGKFWSHRNAW